LEQRLYVLPRPAEAADLAKQCARQEATVAEKDAAVAELRDAPEEVARQEQTLAALAIRVRPISTQRPSPGGAPIWNSSRPPPRTASPK
jgi:hypothetical protein